MVLEHMREVSNEDIKHAVSMLEKKRAFNQSTLRLDEALAAYDEERGVLPAEYIKEVLVAARAYRQYYADEVELTNQLLTATIEMPTEGTIASEIFKVKQERALEAESRKSKEISKTS